MTFKDVAHLYLGCRMVNESVYERSIEQGKTYKPHLFKMVSNNGAFWVSREQDCRNLETTPLKPILRKMEDLTEEHAFELMKTVSVCRSGIPETPETRSKAKAMLNGHTISECPMLDLITGNAHAWTKLISWGYDLFGLIDSGEAIDAKTLEAAP